MCIFVSTKKATQLNKLKFKIMNTYNIKIDLKERKVTIESDKNLSIDAAHEEAEYEVRKNFGEAARYSKWEVVSSRKYIYHV